jgi:hypothetical protein
VRPGELFTLVVVVGFVGLMVACLRLRREAVHQNQGLRDRMGNVQYYTFAATLMASCAVFFAALFMWATP